MLEKMIQIVLGLLAFLGITLLVVLGLILLLLILILFVPIRYRGDFSKDADTMTLRIKGSWLLRIIRVRADYGKELLIQAYMLFFKVFDSGKPAREKKNSKKKKISKKKAPEKEKFSKTEKASETKKAFETGYSPAVGESAETANDRTPEEAAQLTVMKETMPESMVRTTVETTSDTEKGDDSVSETVKEKNEDFSQQASKQSFRDKLYEKIRNILCKIKAICDKIKDVVNNIQYYLELLRADETKALFKRSMSRLLKVLKSIRPRKLETELVIGTGSPDTTGYVMALAGMMYPYFGRHVNIEPDFEKTIFEGKIFVKGRVTVFVLLWQALKIYRDKDLHTFLGKLKREDS